MLIWSGVKLSPGESANLIGITSTLLVSGAGVMSSGRSGGSANMEIAVVSSDSVTAAGVPNAMIVIPGCNVSGMTATLSFVTCPSADATAKPYSPRPLPKKSMWKMRNVPWICIEPDPWVAALSVLAAPNLATLRTLNTSPSSVPVAATRSPLDSESTPAPLMPTLWPSSIRSPR